MNSYCHNSLVPYMISFLPRYDAVPLFDHLSLQSEKIFSVSDGKAWGQGSVCMSHVHCLEYA